MICISTKLELQVKMMESENYVLGYAGAKIIDERGKHIRNFPAKIKVAISFVIY